VQRKEATENIPSLELLILLSQASNLWGSSSKLEDNMVKQNSKRINSMNLVAGSWK
jgi:hypothetical protein